MLHKKQAQIINAQIFQYPKKSLKRVGQNDFWGGGGE